MDFFSGRYDYLMITGFRKIRLTPKAWSQVDMATQLAGYR
jgi:hypothetical protein